LNTMKYIIFIESLFMLHPTANSGFFLMHQTKN
jgi:hypothetical protein